MRPSLVIVGLGNHGKTYDGTRHNAGFMATEVLSQTFDAGEWKDMPKFQARVSEAHITTVPVLLVQPQTYMNRSGECVRKITDFYKLNPAVQILILTDDIDLPLGTLRLRQTGSAGTHNGLKSLIEQYGEAFPRLRIGIGPKPAEGDLATWVLSAFSKEERKTLNESLKQIPEIVTKFVFEAEKSE